MPAKADRKRKPKRSKLDSFLGREPAKPFDIVPDCILPIADALKEVANELTKKIPTLADLQYGETIPSARLALANEKAQYERGRFLIEHAKSRADAALFAQNVEAPRLALREWEDQVHLRVHFQDYPDNVPQDIQEKYWAALDKASESEIYLRSLADMLLKQRPSQLGTNRGVALTAAGGGDDDAEISLAETSQRFDVPLKELSLAWRRAPDDVNRLPARKVGRSVLVKVKDAKRFCDNYLARQEARKIAEPQKGKKPTIKKALEALRAQGAKKSGN